MRKGIHPPHHPVVFRDASTGGEFLTRRTATSNVTITRTDGQASPPITVDVTSRLVAYYRRFPEVLPD